MLLEDRYLPATQGKLPSCTLYLRPTLAGSCLNALRILAKPDIKGAAHVTIRGPYRRMWTDYGLEKRVAATRIAVRSVRKSLGELSVVFFSCKASTLKQIWFDSGFPGFYPHITVYFDTSVKIAEEVYAVMNKYEYGFSFLGANLMVTKNWGPCLKAPDASFDQRVIYDITGRILNKPLIERLPFDDRLSIIEEICSYLSKQSTMKT